MYTPVVVKELIRNISISNKMKVLKRAFHDMQQNVKIMDNRYFIKSIDLLLIINTLKHKRKNVRILTTNAFTGYQIILVKFLVNRKLNLINHSYVMAIIYILRMQICKIELMNIR